MSGRPGPTDGRDGESGREPSADGGAEPADRAPIPDGGAEPAGREPVAPADRRPEFGETWVYESIVGALPGAALSGRAAVAVQLAGFEALVLGLSWYYGLPEAALAGTLAVVVAAGGSVVMARMGRLVRTADVPEPYRRALFGSSVEVVLGLLAFVALVTYLFVVDPSDGAGLLAELAGPEPPAPVVYVGLVVAWDVCYRIGTSWWACVVGAWRSWRYDFDDATVARLRRVDRLNVGFALLQVTLVPVLWGHPVLAGAVVGHVVAVLAVAALSTALLR